MVYADGFNTSDDYHAYLVSAKQKSQYAALQQSIPQGETVLTRLDAPFLLNFKRNQIFLILYFIRLKTAIFR
jgi:hypothetical protein